MTNTGLGRFSDALLESYERWTEATAGNLGPERINEGVMGKKRTTFRIRTHRTY